MVEQLRETLHLNELFSFNTKYLYNNYFKEIWVYQHTKRPGLTDVITYFPATFELVLMSGINDSNRNASWHFIKIKNTFVDHMQE